MFIVCKEYFKLLKVSKNFLNFLTSALVVGSTEAE